MLVLDILQDSGIDTSDIYRKIEKKSMQNMNVIVGWVTGIIVAELGILFGDDQSK